MPSWLAEAAFRCVEENNPDALTGADRGQMADVLFALLEQIVAEHLTEEDRERLHPIAVSQAVTDLTAIDRYDVASQPDGPITWEWARSGN